MRYRLIVSLLLTTWLAVGSAMAGVKVTGNVYGGGNLADVGGSVTVNIEAGQIGDSQIDAQHGNVYGGGALANTNMDNWVNNALTNDPYYAVTITTSTDLTGYYNRTGESAPYTYTAASGTASSGTYYKKRDTKVNLTGGIVKGDVYGGGLGRLEIGTPGETGYLEAKPATEYGDVTVTLNGTQIGTGAGRVFGANNINGTPKGHVKVLVQKTAAVDGQTIDVAAVFGGGNQAAYEPHNAADFAEVDINMPSSGEGQRVVVGNVYGGGNEAGIVAGTEVNILAGDVKSGVYGGCNTSGTVTGNTIVTLTGGTVGTDVTHRANVHGGGYGQQTCVDGNVTVNIGTATSPTPTVYGDVYGGSALGNVNTGTKSNGTPIWDTNRKTQVNLMYGTVNGDIYGGGLGQKASGSGENAVSAVEALVYGDVEVKIGDTDGAQDPTYSGDITINGSVFGCNNLNGTPKGNVNVDVYQTAHTEANTYPSTVTTLEALATKLESSSSADFAIAAVYGGGNKAAYAPESVAQGATRHCTTVHVYSCVNTIQTVYGGGNAADATDVNLVIDGGYFESIFGGGNGYSKTGNHTNPNGEHYNPGANISRSATTVIHGGLYGHVFGGSNQCGTVASAALSIDTSSGCTELIYESFGGANEAVINGDVTTNLACAANKIGTFYGGSNKADISGSVTLNVYGGEYINVFGGSKGTLPPANASDDEKAAASADIGGNVTLNLYGGTMTNAFGGSNINGHIGGKITVNVLNNGGTCALNVTNIYGAGNVTPYTPNYTLAQGETERVSPVVNIIHGTVANVFGGAKGETATVTASPQVNIGYDATTMGDLTTENTLLYSITRDATNYTSQTTPANYLANVTGNVYGGGDLAQVSGNTQINLRKLNSTVGTIYGGGNEANVSGNTTVNINDGTVTDVYGGGALANVGTNSSNTTQVTILGGTITGNVYGGGLGRVAVEDDPATDENEAVSAIAALVNGAVTVTVNGGTVTNVFGCNNLNGSPQSTVTVNINNNVGGNVYGGGNLAAYNPTSHTGAYPAVNINNGTVGGDVFGGGLGSTAVVTGNPVVTIGDANADHYAVVTENVYGGGDAAAVTGNTTVTYNDTHASSTVGNLFGGGNAAGVTGDTEVNLNAGTVSSDVYGGCNTSGTITGTTTVNLLGGSVRDVFGGGLGQNTSVAGNVEVNVGQYDANATPNVSGSTNVTRDVYGGSAKGSVNTNTSNTTTVNLLAGTIAGNVYGGGLGVKSESEDIEAVVNGNVLVSLNEHGGTCIIAGSVFGCNNANGSPSGHVTVHVYKTEPKVGQASNAYDLAAVYGGGNEADYVPTDAKLSTEVIIEGCGSTMIQNVYGGGNAAAVPATEVWILGTKKIENVFGGGNGERGAEYAAHVGYHRTSSGKTAYGSGTGKAETKLVAGNIINVYGGSNSNGDIRSGALITQKATYTGTITSRCDNLVADHVYGGGSHADMTGGADIVLGCMPGDWINEVYAGAESADVGNDVSLTITSGKFGRVFGGNKSSGKIEGGITVNIEEDGNCDVPIVIGELYGGGNLAPYSIYGYKQDGTIRTKEEYEDMSDEEKENEGILSGPYHSPRVNVLAFTSIGNIFGGGYGEAAIMIGDPVVNINEVMVVDANNAPAGKAYDPASDTDKPDFINGVDVTLYPHTANTIGVIGNVFGGGNAAKVIGSTHVNVVTGDSHYNDGNQLKVRFESTEVTHNVAGADIRGSIYGGGNLADVTENTAVTINGGAVGGNVFGGGKGSEYNYLCDKAMVGVMNDGAGKDPTTPENKDKGTKVTITGGTVGTLTNGNSGPLVDGTGNVYGGGEIGRVEWNTQVTIGVENQTEGANAPVIYGSVFGAGAGNETHGFAALVRGNSTVTIQGTAKVMENVYGGGEMATAGRYWVKGIDNHPVSTETQPGAPEDLPSGMPYATRGGGVCTVIVQDNAQIGPDAGASATAGHVFGAGKGVNPHFSYNAEDLEHSSRRMADTGNYVYFTDDSGENGKTGNEKYLEFLQTLALATETHVTISETATVKGSVYGGSENGFVQDDTDVQIQGGTIGTTTYGHVFGGGKGLATFAEAGKVKGNTKVAVSDGTVNGNVYGGGELGGVGKYINSSDMKNFYWTDTPLADIDPEDQASYTYNGTGVCDVDITGGTIGIDGTQSENHGNVFGGGKGQGDTFWCEKAMVYSTDVSISKGTVHGAVFGGGEIGRVEQNTTVTIDASSSSEEDGTDIKGDVFGAGKGLDTHGYSALVRGNPTVTIQGYAKVRGSVYGGGEIASVGRHKVKTKNDPLTPPDAPADLPVGMPYTLDGTNVGICTVTVQGNAEITGNVFGAGKGIVPVDYETASTKPTRMSIDDNGNSFEEQLSSKDIYLIYVQTLALVSDTHVTIGGGTGTTKVKGNVYGGSESGFVQFDTEVKTIGISEIGTANSGGDIYGGGLGIIGNEAAGRVKGSTNVAITGAATIRGSVYGGGENGIVKESTVVNIGVPAVGETAAIRYMGTISKDVYGGGKAADVCQNVTVNVNSGTVTNDVYGGGALANTNIDNWNANGFEEVSGLTAGTSIVTGLYSAANDGSLIDTENQTADANTTYYQKGTWASGKNDPSTGTTYKTTVNLTGGLVGNAYGGALGRKDIAGSAAVPAHGEPGDPDYTPEIPAVAAVTGVAAMVYGDVTVTVNGAKFHQETADEKEKVSFVDEGVARNNVPITKYGRVFGANNANGTPKGNIMVNVKQTVPEEDGAVHTYGYYEIHSVYGGGNLANYLPADGKNTQVLIEGCEDTSIECVYGGGNSASVPQTLVTINGTFEIGMIFGGGNGDDPVKDASGNWGPNPGADVIKVGGVAGTGTINAKGGIIRWLYGGSNKKGLCGHIQENLDPDPLVNCPLKITNVYGAGKNADVESVFIVAKCPSSFGETVEYLYGGSYNARISGDVTMTLIGGQYKNVYGGNDSGGSIGGNITINIQETYDCDPIIIGNLYGGGNRAAYPGNSSANGSITINVKSCTHIGNIFGGGFGGEATVNGTTQVNLNMTKGLWATDKNNVPFVLSRDKADFDGKTNEQIKNAIEAEIPNIEVVDLTNATFDREKYTIKCKVKNELGTIGNVYGGGDEAAVHGTTEVNIGTQSTVAIMQHNNDGVPVKNNGTAESPVYIPIFDNDGKLISGYTYADIAYTSTPVLGANITGNVYGGGNNANVTENTYVNICAKENTTTHEYESVTLASGAVGVTIEGTERHGVFGGGNLGIVEGDTYIHQGGGNVNQSVYGGGCEADVKGNTYVTMLDGYVEDGVYGGGLMGSVGTFTRAALPSGHTNHDGCVGGKPDTFTDDTGKCTVVISGGQIGPDAAANNGMTANEIVDVGFVFGAGRGDVENPDVDPDADFHTYVYETDVTIKGTALIMASVYGGGENGRVRGNTLVKIEGGQIGCGNGSLDENDKPKPYEENQFIDPTTTTVSGGSGGNALAECSHWPYGREDGNNLVYETYDPYAGDAPTLYPGGSSTQPSDGKTYYGCVFGGGSGYYPYEIRNSSDQLTGYDWLPSAGLVEGNTEVRISGGHILTNVYGGNEYTDVLGSCTVTMSGGTLGVPRTLEQIKNHPVTCYLFGAGKGDPRTHFNKLTNVGSVTVEVSGGIIYGSVFGGGEDGHVTGNVDLTITKGEDYIVGGITYKNGPIIGTWGTSYVDGNVFGGGRGFAGDAYTAGNVGGSVALNISGGTMLGSIYGGGRLGSVGYDLRNVNETGYGEMSTDDSRGHVTIDISGGTIGNDHEFKYIPANTTIDDNYRTTNHVPYTLFDGTKLMHTKGGNVFAGGMGRREDLNGNPIVHDLTDPSSIDWHKLGNVKSTKLTISGTAWIKGNVYGGGEFGAVTGSHAAKDAQNEDINVGTEIIVNGGTIGTEITETTPQKATVTTANTVKYTFGSVYGGGMGSEDHDANDNHGGNVVNNTSVNISGATTKVRASVFGGGEMSTVESDTYVTVSGGEIGRNEVRPKNDDNEGYVMFGGATMGNVYGGGKGHVEHALAGLVKGNTYVTINAGTTTGQPFIYHNVYGGGALGSVGTFSTSTGTGEQSYIPKGIPFGWTNNTGTANVTITGGTIGISGRDNGMVNGSSRGDIETPIDEDPNDNQKIYVDRYDRLAWVNNSIVTIGTEDDTTDGPIIKGSVYGGGENGHNAADATVTMYSGTIGIADSRDPWYIFTKPAVAEKAMITRGNVYGAGCGTDMYDSNNDGEDDMNNPWAGLVAGNTHVTVSGGEVTNNVYGGGSMGAVGTMTNDLTAASSQHRSESADGILYDFGLSWPLEITYGAGTGLAEVTINGTAKIDGYVYGGARGKVDFGVSDITEQRYVEARFANVRETNVVIGTAGNNSTPTIRTVYGGGEDGHVYENTSVTINGGAIARTVFGGGKGTSTFSGKLLYITKPTGVASDDYDADIHSWTAGKVYGNTTVTMNGGSVGWFVYGGGNMASVGKGNYSGGHDDYAPKGYGELPSASGNLWTTAYTEQSPTKDMAWHFLNSGITTVNILGGTVGTTEGSLVDNTYKSYDESGVPYGSVFGGSRGKAAATCILSPRYKYVPDFFLGYVNKAIINIGGTSATSPSANSPTIYGSVYGGGQDGHVRNSTEVHIFKGNIAGQAPTTDTSARSGHVFGAGSGIGTYHDNSDNKDKCNNSSGSVTCTTLVEVYGENNDNESTATTKIKGNIYGGGAMASVGPPQTGQGYDEYEAPNGDHKSYSHTQVNIKGGRIGGSVFASSRGPSDAFRKQSFDDKDIDYDPYSYATVLWPNVHVSGGKIVGSVYGGGETGYAKCGVDVNITGGTIDTDVYGGGAMAHTNIGNLKQDRETKVWSWTDNTNRTAKYTTIVNLLGGTIGGDAYGGGLGRREYGTSGQDGYESAVEAKVYGDVRVNLNGLETADYDDGIHGETPGIGERLEKLSNNNYQVKDAAKGAIVNRVFGCNNLLGSPQGKVRVHVFGTQNADAQHNTINLKYPIPTDNSTVSVYDVEAVYGGGNLAAYTPMGPSAPGKNSTTIVDDYLNTTQKTEVIIDGCHRTSIKQVYGGGNAAPVPETRVEVNGTYEIDEVFGGGNGDTNYTLVENGVTKYYQNPGANVGYRNYTTVNKNDAEHDGSTDANAYPAVENSDAATKELRQANYTYGTGIATTEIKGGRIHVVYGGSNKKGNISTTALSMYEGMNDECPMEVDESYGAGKDAPIDGVVDVKMKCATGVKELFGGAKNSDVNSDINLTITNGSSLQRVFGGNNTSGAIAGSITVNIEEGGCEPIHIGELYLGGYLAPYSIYGYEDDGHGGYATFTDDNGIEQRKPILKAARENWYSKNWYSWDAYKTYLSGLINTVQTWVDNSENASDPNYQYRVVELAALKERLNSYPKKEPRINVISATRIDNIFGGGYKAMVVGSPHINVNMTNGKVEVEKMEKTAQDNTTLTVTEGDGKTYVYKDAYGSFYDPEVIETGNTVTLDIGSIGNIYGGGNMAPVFGDTYLEIGTGEWLNKDDQREMLGTTTTITTPTTFTYKRVSEEATAEQWTYERATTETVAIEGTPTPVTGSQIPETPANGEQVQGTANGITTPTTFTYDSSQGKWTYERATTETVAIDGTPTPARYTATIDGDVFGGGNLGDVGQTHEVTENGTTSDVIDAIGNTYVTIGAKKETDNTYSSVVPGVTITGNVFGGGKGDNTTFRCGKAMVTGGTNIVMGNGTVEHSVRQDGTETGTVYGGGMIGRVEENTSVTIGLGDGVASGTPTSAPVIEGSVFGAGKGLNTHGYSALVRGSSTVTVQGNAKIGQSVYGGGEVASVGRYNIGSDGLPVTLVDPTSSISGHCFVTVKGYSEIGPDNMVMNHLNNDGSQKVDEHENLLPPDDSGYIFGAGKGALPFENITDSQGRPGRMLPGTNEMSYYYDPNPVKECTEDYSKYLRTLSLATQTDVTVEGHAFVKGAVYGGGENGFVQYDTHVVIDGDCQIGNGHILLKNADTGAIIANRGLNRRYTDAEWAAGHLSVTNADFTAEELAANSDLVNAVNTHFANSLPECASWPYGVTEGTGENAKTIYAPYDPNALETVGNEEKYANGESTEGGRKTGSDGHTFYGNVFGGGSGFWPYAPGLWYEYAGSVYGNSIVDIKGGHILTSVYGGNELTNVGRYKYTAISLGQGNTTTDIELLSGGDCYVTMTGGTLGVPRTVEEIAAHPVTCYLFGSGKGDQRIFFNTATNVGNAFVHVSDDARIYGSVFGGGEDGHVIKDVELSIGSSTLPSTLPTKSVFTGVTLAGRKAVTIGGNTVNYPYIGTTGTSYVDGNIFGAGRGYSGEALTAGSVGGNVEVNIKGGTMLGSVYGGGRMASVGTLFTSSTDPYYGQLQEDNETSTHGHITVNISGGTIGNDLEDITVDHPKGGNVFGGSMGRLELQDGTINPLWPKMAVSKTTRVNISGDALIKSNVYGGGEFSMVRGDTYVTIGGVLGNDNETITSTEADAPTIKRDVYGGGYGSDDYTTETTITAGGFGASTYTFTPMQFAGIVCGDTYVNMKRGWVMKNVYGGGEMATVGLIDFTNAEKHDDHDGTIGETSEKLYGFALSWPYKMDFITHDGTNIGGTTHVNITGGRLGLTGKDFLGPFDDQGRPLDVTNNNAVLDPNDANDAKKIKAARIDNGDIYGGGKGLAGDRYDYAFCANVKDTHVTISYPSDNGATPANYKTKDGDTYTYDCVSGAVYGGGENGHVIGNTEVKLTNGLVGHAIYGGGSGKGTYQKTLYKIGSTTETHPVDIYSVTAGKVYGNTKVEMTGGYVVRNIYGGGNMGSVGKGNYASGTDDYYTAGYGETLRDAGLWTPSTTFKPDEPIGGSNQPTTMADYFLSSGKTEVIVTGGQVGYVDSKPGDSMKDGLPYGNIFGGCRGESAPNIQESPRYLYSPEFFSGYVNETKVTIGTSGETTGPKILGSVYGGGQDGHVRRDTYVTINSGEIGLPFTDLTVDKWRTKFGKEENTTLNEELDNPQWLYRGNIYGAGSGIGKYEYDFNGNGRHTKEAGQDEEVEDNIEEWNYVNPVTNRTTQMKEIDFSTSAGSVTRFTKVEVNGGTIHRNVYGGGSLSSVGPPTIPPTRTDLAEKKHEPTQAEITAKKGVGWQSFNEVIIKGTIGTPTDYQEHYGGEVYGASRGDLTLDVEDPTEFGSSVWTQVFIKNGAHIMGNVFGGGDNGKVKRDAEVFIGEPDTTSSSGTSDDSGSGGNDPGGNSEPSGDPGSDNP